MMDVYMDDMRTPPTVGWIVVRTIEEVKELLRRGVVYNLSLDHDMGACEECVKAHRDVGDFSTPETTFVSWCRHAEDGTKLVHWMIETGNWPVEKPTVHSMNPVGRARMKGMIDRYWGERHDQGV